MIIIKSQDNETIGRFIEIKADEKVVKGLSQFGSLTVLGTYTSRERAIEVIEDICRRIKHGSKMDYMNPRIKGERVHKEFVFEMPSK